jgi:hypothetical protein
VILFITKQKDHAVHGLQLLHNYFLKSCSQIHIIRLSSLMDAVHGLLKCSKLTLVNIGRHLVKSQPVLVKNKIKQIDRLLGNDHLYSERSKIYSSLISLLISPYSKPIITVDWSGVTHCGAFHMIRASISIGGRTLTLYEEVYPEKKKDSPKANKFFLKNLARILPIGCRPIIVTDAGFRNPWFAEVLKLGWDFVGRVRNRTQVCEKDEKIWKTCKELYEKATLKAKFIGEYWLAKTNPLQCRMYLIREKSKHRKKKNLRGDKARCSSSLKHAKRGKEPWLIATSISSYSAKKIIWIYKLRMKIEQGFRDIKNQRQGLCLRETRSNGVKRLSILLLIAAIATFIICIYGHACQLLKLQYQYQTNSIKHRIVLSWFSLGMIVIREQLLPRDIIDLVFKKKILRDMYYG